MPQDKDELLQVLITKYAQMYMKLAYAIGVPYDCELCKKVTLNAIMDSKTS